MDRSLHPRWRRNKPRGDRRRLGTGQRGDIAISGSTALRVMIRHYGIIIRQTGHVFFSPMATERGASRCTEWPYCGISARRWVQGGTV